MKVRLGDVATYINGYAFKPSDWSDSGVPIIRIQDLTGNSYQANRYSGEYAKKYEVLPGDVLISWSASFGVYIWTAEKAVLNQHIFKVVFDKCKVDKSFFVHQVQNILERAESSSHGATMKHLTKPVFDALPFYLPPLDEQRRIAAVLDKVSDLIAKRRAQLDKLDELVKAQFAEMFGDPERNPKHWPVLSMNQTCKVGSSKRIYKSEHTSNGIPFLRVSNLTDLINTGMSTPDLYIPEELYNELKNQGQVPTAGDILLTSRGTLGQCYIVKENDEFYFQDGMISWLSNFSDCITPLYLSYLFAMPGFRRQIESIQAGTTVSYLSISMINRLSVMLPTMELQISFSSFVKHTDGMKLTIQQSLDKLEMLKKTLMQGYFG